MIDLLKWPVIRTLIHRTNSKNSWSFILLSSSFRFAKKHKYKKTFCWHSFWSRRHYPNVILDHAIATWNETASVIPSRGIQQNCQLQITASVKHSQPPRVVITIIILARARSCINVIHVTKARNRRWTITQRSVWKEGARSVTRSWRNSLRCVSFAGRAHRKWVRG